MCWLGDLVDWVRWVFVIDIWSPEDLDDDDDDNVLGLSATALELIVDTPGMSLVYRPLGGILAWEILTIAPEKRHLRILGTKIPPFLPISIRPIESAAMSRNSQTKAGGMGYLVSQLNPFFIGASDTSDARASDTSFPSQIERLIITCHADGLCIRLYLLIARHL